MSAAPAADGGARRGRREDRRRELKASVNSAVRLLGSIAATRSWRVAGHFLGYFYRKAVLRTPVPFYISLAVTNRCQGRCVHCYSFLQRHEERPELTTAELESVIDQAARLGIFQVIFTGGEPLLRKDILELIGHARRRGLLTRLNTNSLLLDRDMALALKKAGLGQCALSLDDADPETHDRMRGLPGHHARTLANLSMLRDLGYLRAGQRLYLEAAPGLGPGEDDRAWPGRRAPAASSSCPPWLRGDGKRNSTRSRTPKGWRGYAISRT